MMMQDSATDNCRSKFLGLLLNNLCHPLPAAAQNILHLADAWQHFAGTTVMVIDGVGRLTLLYVPETSYYLHFILN